MMNTENKDATLLEPRPLYGIGTVARLTGLKPDTLRVWERRYGLGASHKTVSGRRQYTQSDLEHLQIVAMLVADGARIGEIAKSERKTSEMLVQNRSRKLAKTLPPRKPQVVFVGAELCRWLEEHQGCISAISAYLMRGDLTAAVDQLQLNEPADMLVVECPAGSTGQLNGIEALAKRIGAERTLVVYRLGNDKWLEDLARRDMRAMPFPPDPARLAFEVGRVAVAHQTEQGEFDLGDLVRVKDRTFSDSELNAARDLKSTLNCECPKHIADLITALASFEQYSSECSVENWHDAAVHACIYAYTNQSRWLMEKALSAVLEDRGQEFQSLINANNIMLSNEVN